MMNGSTIELDRRNFMMAMDAIPRIMNSSESITLKKIQFLQAVSYDFFNHQLNVDISSKLIQGIITNKISQDRQQLFLICLGFLSSPMILVSVKNAIIKQKFEIAEYVLPELLSLTNQLCEVLSPEAILTNEERKEELARRLLLLFKIGIIGETEAESTAILESLDSVEIHKLTSELEIKKRAQRQKK